MHAPSTPAMDTAPGPEIAKVEIVAKSFSQLRGLCHRQARGHIQGKRPDGSTCAPRQDVTVWRSAATTEQPGQTLYPHGYLQGAGGSCQPWLGSVSGTHLTTVWRRTAERRHNMVRWPISPRERSTTLAPFRIIAPLDEKLTASLAKN
jgi:hypothetical protein